MDWGDVTILTLAALSHISQRQDLFPMLAEFQGRAHFVVIPGPHIHPHTENPGLACGSRQDIDVGIVLESLVDVRSPHVTEVNHVDLPGLDGGNLGSHLSSHVNKHHAVHVG